MFDFRPKVQVTIEQTGESYPCAIGESLLKGMLRLGRKGIPAGCVNGGCGVCKVRITSGSTELLGPISRAHVSEYEETQGYTLACRVGPTVEVWQRERQAWTPSIRLTTSAPTGRAA